MEMTSKMNVNGQDFIVEIKSKREAQLEIAIQNAIQALDKTKSAFKSKRIKEIKENLSKVLLTDQSVIFD